MRIIKLGIISFVFFAVIISFFSLFMPSEVRISKAINLAPEQKAVLRTLADTAGWPAWHPAFENGHNTHLKKTVVALTDTLVVVDILQASSAKTVRNSWHLHQFGASDSITLQWYMDFKLSPLPWHKFSSLFYEATYGRMMQQGLINLKKQQSGT